MKHGSKTMKNFRLTETVRERKIHVINKCNCKSHTKRHSLMFGYLMKKKIFIRLHLRFISIPGCRMFRTITACI